MLTETCHVTQKPFSISQTEIEAYEHFGLPLPRLAPEERYRRLLLFRNEHRFFWRTCDMTAQRIYSVFAQSAPFPVVDVNYWWSDHFDATIYERKFNRKRSFFEQLFELWKRVPRPACSTLDCHNVRAVHDAQHVSNSFLVSDAYRAHDCYYCVGLWDCAWCIDCFNLHDSQYCYGSINCHNSSRLRWCENCSSCANSWFLAECSDCSNCLFCTNLHGKEYHIYNNPVSAEEFERTLRGWGFTARPQVEQGRDEFADFLKDKPVPHVVDSALAGGPTENDGNYFYNCSKAESSFQCSSSKNIVHCHHLSQAKHCLEGYGFGDGLEEAAQFVAVGANAKHVINCIECWGNVQDLTYSTFCTDSAHLLGCVGLRGKEYCILNKQYSKSDYQKVYGQIQTQMRDRELWGEFYPLIFSGFAYNFSSALDYMPLNAVQASMLRFPWDESYSDIRPSQLLSGTEHQHVTERFAELPQRLEEIDISSTADSIYLCEMTGRPFQLTAEELALYADLGVAPPSRCFEQRHRELISRLAPKRMRAYPLEDGTRVRTAFPKNWRRPVVHADRWHSKRNLNAQEG